MAKRIVGPEGVPIAVLIKWREIYQVAKRIVGPEGVPITITCRVRRSLNGTTMDVDKPVTLIRQPPVHIPERLCEGPIGLGIDLVRLDNGHYQGTASVSQKSAGVLGARQS